jgi:hypothetical protein
MVNIISEQGYPKDNQILARVDYFIKARPCEGGILIIGKDSQRREYKPKNNPKVRDSYTLPSGLNYAVPRGRGPEENHPAIFFPFNLNCRLSSSEITAKADANEDFMEDLEMVIMDEYGKPISLDNSINNFFKFLACWAVLELADVTMQGVVRNHFWGEMYVPRNPDFEKFLEEYRK